MKKLREYFNFNRSERNGALILIFLILLVATFPQWWVVFAQEETEFEIASFKAQVDSFIANQEIIEEQKKQKYFAYPSSTTYKKKKSFDYKNISKSAAEHKITPIYFNPNNLPKEKWEEMGFTEKQIGVIKNYEKKGGKFYRKEDLRKIYSIDDETYQLLEPYIIIPKDTVQHENVEKSKPTIDYKNLVVDINTADTAELKKLRGIGDAYSQRIVKYRNSLGGFVKKEQLLEVWGLSKELFETISDNISLSKMPIKKININSANIDALKKHPYVDFYVARSIVKYRQAHGKYKNIHDITQSELVHEDLYQKLEPYLTLD